MGDQKSLLNFYSGLDEDNRGRSLREVQSWPDDKLERTHDDIQWLFPLEERSGFNVDAPILNDELIRQFRMRLELRAKLRASFLRMLAFYGLELVEDEPLRVVPSSAFRERSANWLTPSNHNHLRLTRILKSARLLGIKEETEAFFACLAALYRMETATGSPRISEETFDHWRTAATDQP